jgi:hypothetical protein
VTDVTCQIANDTLVMRITCQSSDYGTLSVGFKIFNVGKWRCFHSISKLTHPDRRADGTLSVARLCTGDTPLPAVDDARQQLAQPCQQVVLRQAAVLPYLWPDETAQRL